MAAARSWQKQPEMASWASVGDARSEDVLKVEGGGGDRGCPRPPRGTGWWSPVADVPTARLAGSRTGAKRYAPHHPRLQRKQGRCQALPFLYPLPWGSKTAPPPPLSWILRLCPGAGSHPLAPTRGRREESCSSRSCCSDSGWAQSGSGEALTCFNPLSRLLSSRLLILKREKEAVPGER